MARSRYDGHPERMPMDGHGVLGLCAPRAWYGVAAIPPPPPPPCGGLSVGRCRWHCRTQRLLSGGALILYSISFL
jgi:hypothetical protein